MGLRRTAPRLALLFAATTLMAGCMASGRGLESAGVDRSIVTSSVPKGPPADPVRLSDDATIRDAVSSVDLDSLGGKPIAWANSSTGTRGAISAIAQYSENGRICRRFRTTREAFDGVRLLSGRACLVMGSWQLQALEEA